MAMFPGAGAQVYRNEAGEPIGWDYPNDEPDPGDPYDDYDEAPDDYCDACGQALEDDPALCPSCGEDLLP